MTSGRLPNFARTIKVRISPDLLNRLPLLRPEIYEMNDPTKVRYGALSLYIEHLIQRDLQKIESKLP